VRYLGWWRHSGSCGRSLRKCTLSLVKLVLTIQGKGFFIPCQEFESVAVRQVIEMLLFALV